MRVAYFVHDVTDPAVARRVRMLKAAGARVILLGFRRADSAVAEVEGSTVFDLGRTYDSRLGQRALSVLQRRAALGEGARAIGDADVFLARNLEMLAVAEAAQRAYAPAASLVYECLDLHRLMLSESVAGRLLRSIERALMRKARLLIVSSPAFVSRYFTPRQGVGLSWDAPVMVVENKLLDLSGPEAPSTAFQRPAGPPWRIGWFGMIRCQKSLDILCNLASSNPGLVEIVIRGRPAQTAFHDFDGQIARAPGVTFGGPYRPAELGALYGDVHFNWAIDYFEDGGNSALLLPNRIYEGGAHAAVPIALARTETGRWLQRRRLGVLLESPADELASFLRQLTPAALEQLRKAAQDEPRHSFVAVQEDCEQLLNALELAVNAQPARAIREASRGRAQPSGSLSRG